MDQTIRFVTTSDGAKLAYAISGSGRARTELVRVGWGTETPAYRRMFAELFIPGASAEQIAWFSELQRRTAQLTKDDNPVAIEQRAFNVLLYLIE